MNSVKTRQQLAEDIATEYYEGNVQNLLADVKAAGSVEYFIEGGALAVYYYDQRKELQEIFGQSDTEAAEYSDEKVWSTYKNVMGAAIQRLQNKWGK